jgi:hypothetical protein
VSTLLPQVRTNSERLGSKPLLAQAHGIAWLTLAYGIFFTVIRLAFCGFLLLTSVYCLLLSVPFSYFGFIHNPLLAWLPLFVRLHGAIYALLIAALALTLIPELRRNQTRRSTIAFLVLNASMAIYLWRTDALAGLQLDFRSYLWSMLSLFPMLWLAALDLSGRKFWLPPENGHRLDLAKTTIAAAIISISFAATSLLRAGGALTSSLALHGFAASLCFHLVIFTAVGVVVAVIRFATQKTSWPEALNFTLMRLFAWLLFAQLLREIVLPTISFEGIQATIFAAVISFILVFSFTGFAARVRSLFSITHDPITTVGAAAWPWALAAGASFACAYAIPSALAANDWDFVLQRMAVIALWLAVLQIAGWTGIRARGYASVALSVVLAVAAIGFLRYAKLALYAAEPSSSSQEIVEAYAGADISFKTAYDVLSRPIDSQSSRQFYEFLKQNTNLGPNASAAPADIRLVANLQPTRGNKPNIFLFVIDSLRPDFISPYNPAVDYTPEIGRFATDSVVLENGFTRYAGTALSEPAIWTGAMQLHKQYIEPFYPMNNLQELLDTDGYQSYISVDPILGIILHPAASITKLDLKTKSWGDLDFVPTLKELESKIDQRVDRNRPIFAYTQPQNVHTLTLERSKIPGGRKAASIYELRRMDAAFGEFIGFLRRRGLYDNSIIILTADHGDCYGEFGRYGHSDFLVPQVIRIPLIIHLPPGMRAKMVWDTRQLAFTTDITPSLYYLLGHRPILNHELAGRPLFTQTQQEQLAYLHSNYLLVSSYAPVYGVLSGNGQSLFIADAVNARSYYYNLAQDPQGAHNHVTVRLQNENEVLIRKQVGLIDDLYGWHPTHAGQ